MRNLIIIRDLAENKFQGLFEEEVQYKHHRGGYCLEINNLLFASTFHKTNWLHSNLNKQIRVNNSTWLRYLFYLCNWPFTWLVVLSVQQLVLSHPWGLSFPKIITLEIDKELGLFKSKDVLNSYEITILNNDRNS